MNINNKYGWKKQVPDDRDFTIHTLKSVRPMATVLPPVVNLRKWCSEIQDQKNIGSCTANAWAGLLQYNQNKYPLKGRKYFNMSRLFIYYNERVIEGTANEDSGAQLRDGAKAIATYGSCAEYDWPYDTSKFTIKPTEACFKVAYPNHIHSYYSLDGRTPDQTLNNLKTCIASEQPFVFGFTVYESFESDVVAKTGIMPMPNVNAEQILGGHAVMAVAFDSYKQCFLVRNSWGGGWGLKGTNAGYFWMPFEFISNPHFACDMWTLIKEI